MNRLYASPLRVYLIIAFLAVIGIWAGLRLPVSLFPNSNQPRFGVSYAMGSFSADEFKRLYGDSLDANLQNIKTSLVEVERVEINYQDQRFVADVICTWGSNPDAAKREIELVLSTMASAMPEDIRRSQSIWLNNSESSMYAVSFSSPKRTLDELHQYLEPLLVPEVRRLRDVGETDFWNPSQKEVRLELKPEVMAQMNITTRDVENAVTEALGSRSGGAMVTENGSLPIQVPRVVSSVEEMNHLMLPLRGGRSVPLAELAAVRYDQARNDASAFKVDGFSTVLLMAHPKPGANLKRMAEEAEEVVQRVRASLPADIKSRVILDPSEFIGSAVKNVLKEVIIGSLLASLILFLFIGSLRNVATAAIEIPISIALAFIMMWFFHMNMNLLSLAGLALAAGMNVDASVVVMENIFRHFEEKKGQLTFQEKLQTITEAVHEVRLPVIASTLASLVVFVPFMFISGLSYAILGDLAKAVIFSHGFSAAVALILVPTVRLHLMRGQKSVEHKAALADRPLEILEKAYIRILRYFMRRPVQSLLILGVPLALLAGVALFALPRLPREIVGKPEADWIGMEIGVEGQTKLRQMDGFIEALHREIEDKIPGFKDKVKFSFDQVRRPGGGSVLFRLKDKHDMDDIHKKLEKAFPSGNGRHYFLFEWTPSEFRLPEAQVLRVAINGGESEDRVMAGRDLIQSLESLRVLRDISTSPDLERRNRLRVTIDPMQHAMLTEQGLRWDASIISDTLLTATRGKWLGQMMIDGRNTPILMSFAEDAVQSPADIEAFPMNLGGRILPLKVLAQVKEQPITDRLYSENGRELLLLTATLPKEKQDRSLVYQKQVEDQVRTWMKDRLPQLGLRPLAVSILEANLDLSDGMRQLRLAFSWSIILIFFAMILQFGSFYESILVLVAVPLGLLGAVVSLFIWQSTLSVNAVLGMILLNGIAVNNSIILVDFTRRLYADGLDPTEAILQAAHKRLRPILITTLTTILAMLPIASGYGEGGRVLQPLGIAVVGGLWLSTLLTLLLVPLLHSVRLNRQQKKRDRSRSIAVAALLLALSTAAFAPKSEAATLNADQQKLLQLLDQLIENDPLWQKAEKDIRQQEELLVALKGAALPQLNAALRRESIRYAEAPDSSYSRSYANGTASLNLYRFGQDEARWAEADASAKALNEQRRVARLEAETRITTLLFDLWASEEEIALITKIRSLRERLLKVASQQYDRGLLAVQDKQKIELDRRSIELNANEAQQRVDLARRSLTLLKAEALPPGKWFLNQTEVDLPKTWDQVVIEHPQYAAAAARLKASEARTRKLWADQTPSLDFNGELGKDLARSDTYGTTTSFALVFTVPLLNGLGPSSAYKSQVEAEGAQGFELENTRRALLLDLENQTRSLSRDAEAVRLREGFVQTARSIYEAGLKRFERGLVSVNDLSTDENRLYSYERERNEGLRQFHQTLVAVCHSYGFTLNACLGPIKHRAEPAG